MKAQETATKTQIYFQQKRKCKINKTASRISRSATASVSVLYKEYKLVSNIKNVNVMLRIWTIMLKLHLVDLWLIYYTCTTEFATNSVNWWSLSLKPYVASTVQGARNIGLSSTALLISVNGVAKLFLKSTVSHAKMGHVNISRLFWGWFIIFLQDLI